MWWRFTPVNSIDLYLILTAAYNSLYEYSTACLFTSLLMAILAFKEDIPLIFQFVTYNFRRCWNEHSHTRFPVHMYEISFVIYLDVELIGQKVMYILKLTRG